MKNTSTKNQSVQIPTYRDIPCACVFGVVLGIALLGMLYLVGLAFNESADKGAREARMEIIESKITWRHAAETQARTARLSH